jgi:hypothetical protein
MSSSQSFEAKLVPKKGRTFPKKILCHRKIPINEDYGFTLSIWVADTPESNKRPTINLVMSHSSHTFRLCFDSVTAMLEAATLVRKFILDKAFVVNDAANEAMKEYFEHHERKRMLSLNDNTALTVIQDISESKYRGRRKFVNKQTGEIIEA